MLQVLLLFLLSYFSIKNWRIPLFATIVVLSTFLVNIVLKNLFARLRPDETLRLVEISEGSLSYPSGHSMTAIAFYGFLALLVIRTKVKSYLKVLINLVLIVLILVVGISRIYLGVHYPSDVLAGFWTGLICLMVFAIAIGKDQTKF